MTDLRKAAELALEALEEYCITRTITRPIASSDALRQALAQEQTKCPCCGEVNPAEIHTCSPQVAQEQESVAWQEMVVANLVRLGVVKHKAKELAYHFYTYDPPPKREWVELTDAELAEFSDMKLGAYDLCLEVEAKLMEKNGGS